MDSIQEREIFTVSDLTAKIKQLLENTLPACWLSGEVSNVRYQASGHVYFSLKDSDSQISAVLFRGNAAQQKITLSNGLKVLAFGEVNVYPPRGTYQLIVRVVFEEGIGRLQEAFERLKRQLDSEGLFNASRKQPLPLLPRTVGFITSATGAALRDFVSVLTRRGWNGQLVVLPARVQGKEAAAEMIAMLEVAQELKEIDVLVIGRGGGSMEDLWAFNEEPLVRAVAGCPLPILSAVGHEIDFTLCDFAADKRAETPTAAAELISSSFIECRNRFESAGETLVESLDNRVDRMTHQLEIVHNRLVAFAPERVIEQYWLKLDDLSNRFQSGLRERIYLSRQKLAEVGSRLSISSPENKIQLARLRLQQLKGRYQRLTQTALEQPLRKMRDLEKRLQSASLENILARGFVLVKDRQGRFITRKKDLRPGDRLINQFADGEVPVDVTD